MEVGLYPGMNRDTYDGIEALNQSTVKIAYEKSLMHAHYKLMHPTMSTDDQVLGQALHTLILEPEHFKARFGIMPTKENGDRLSRRTKAGEIAWAEYDENHAGKHPIKPQKIAELQMVRDNVLKDPLASQLIEAATHKEVSFVWEHPQHDFLCKGQADLLTVHEGWTCCVDLKSAIDASPAGFSRAVANYGYMVQHHWYLEGLNAIAEAERRFLFIAFEKTPPYAVCVHELDGQSILEGQFRCDRVSKDWDKAINGGGFPGYPGGINMTRAMRWAMTHEQEFEEVEI